MKRILAFGVATAVVAAGSFLALSARAGDAPAAGAPAAGAPPATCPPPLKKIDHPFLNAQIGEWTSTYVAAPMTPDGKPEEGTATSKVTLAVGGTAIVDDYSATSMGGQAYHGHGVYKLGDDGKTVKCWWFDSMSPEPMAFSGTVTDTTLEISGTMPGGMGNMKIVSKKVDGGFDWEATSDGKPMLSQKFRKVSK